MYIWREARKLLGEPRFCPIF